MTSLGFRRWLLAGFILAVLLGVLLYQLFAPGTALRYYRCQLGSIKDSEMWFTFTTVDKQVLCFFSCTPWFSLSLFAHTGALGRDQDGGILGSFAHFLFLFVWTEHYRIQTLWSSRPLDKGEPGLQKSLFSGLSLVEGFRPPPLPPPLLDPPLLSLS